MINADKSFLYEDITIKIIAGMKSAQSALYLTMREVSSYEYIYGN